MYMYRMKEKRSKKTEKLKSKKLKRKKTLIEHVRKLYIFHILMTTGFVCKSQASYFTVDCVLLNVEHAIKIHFINKKVEKKFEKS